MLFIRLRASTRVVDRRRSFCCNLSERNLFPEGLIDRAGVCDGEQFLSFPVVEPPGYIN